MCVFVCVSHLISFVHKKMVSCKKYRLTGFKVIFETHAKYGKKSKD